MESAKSVPRGYILYENDDIAVIATLYSENGKTDNMIQIWSINRNESPWDAIRTGADVKVCFDCKLRGPLNKRPCFTHPMLGIGPVWMAYRAGNYPFLQLRHYPLVFSGREVRFGAYGESILLPFRRFKAIARIAKGHTGYTHQWRKAKYQRFKAFLMASCDSPADFYEAQAMGWRTFRIRTPEQPLLPGEITCPASREAGYRTCCKDCLLCDGNKGERETRKSIVTIVHGNGAKHFIQLVA